jgi:Uma2 family endonuclease
MATATRQRKMTAEKFLKWAMRPENAARNLELDAGEVVEVPSPIREHAYYCWMVIKILTEYVTKRGKGYLLTNDCGILVERDPDTVRGADVILFLRDVEEKDFEKKYVEDVPELIVEVISPSDTAKRINRRVSQYLERGIPLVWLINFENTTVSVCRPNEFPRVLDETDELSGNGILTGFSCKVADLFTLPAKKSARRPRKGHRE